MSEKALAILHSPRALIDFVWYYCTHGTDKEWDVLCIRCDKKIVIRDACLRSGIFKNVFVNETDLNSAGLKTKLGLFLRMAAAAVTGKKPEFAKTYLGQYTSDTEYDLYLIPCDALNLAMAMPVVLAKEKEVVILEDGNGDYLPRSKKYAWRYGVNAENIIAFVLSKMGFSTENRQGRKYWIENTKYCSKFCAYPDQLEYRNYRSIQPTDYRNMENADLFEDIQRRMFNIDRNLRADVLLFTSPFDEAANDRVPGGITEATVRYITDKYHPGSVLVKKHQRDTSDYRFDPSIKKDMIDPSVPGEVLLNIVHAKKHIYMFPSSILSAYRDYSDIDVLIYDGLYQNALAYREGIDHCRKMYDAPGIDYVRVSGMI